MECRAPRKLFLATAGLDVGIGHLTHTWVSDKSRASIVVFTS